MKQFIIVIFCGLMLLPILSMAQIPHPERYLIFYGNRYGVPDTVMSGSLIRVPIWARTDPDDYVDTVAIMHNPLKSLNRIIAERDSGECLNFYGPLCYGENFCEFTPAHPAGNDSTSQGMLWIGDYGTIGGPCFLWTGGDTVQVGTFKMHVTEDTSLAGHSYCPFAEGRDPANGGLLWGFADGLSQVIPVATYGCLYIKLISYLDGDANADWVFNALDIVYMLNYLKGMGNPPPYYWDCANGRLYATADANGNCVFNGLDITYSVNYLKGFGPAPRKCPDC